MGSDTLTHPYRTVNNKCSPAILLYALGRKGSRVADVYLIKSPGCCSAYFFLLGPKLGSDILSHPYRKFNKTCSTAILLSALAI